MVERSYLSIGEVLTLLREEFPDVTISKIRFLESRGLLVPERTPSGYRKFYDHDVDRLRWILRQQREHFLPLKVIKGRLEGAEPESERQALFEMERDPKRRSPGTSSGKDAPLMSPAAHGSAGHEAVSRETVGRDAPRHEALFAGLRAASGLGATHGPTRSPGLSGGAATGQVASNGALDGGEDPSGPRGDVVEAIMPTASRASSAGRQGAAGAGGALGPTPVGTAGVAARAGDSGLALGAGSSSSGGPEKGATTPGDSAAPGKPPTAEGDLAAPAAGRRAPGGSGARTGSGQDTEPATPDPSRSGRAAGEPAPHLTRGEMRPAESEGAALLVGVSLTLGELAQATGLDEKDVAQLESYGLIGSRSIAGVPCYDEGALSVATLAADFACFGVEARHLRLFRHAADRQVDLYNQIVSPMLRRRNPEAHRRALQDLNRLAELGAALQASFTRAAIREYSG